MGTPKLHERTNVVCTIVIQSHVVLLEPSKFRQQYDMRLDNNNTCFRRLLLVKTQSLLLEVLSYVIRPAKSSSPTAPPTTRYASAPPVPPLLDFLHVYLMFSVVSLFYT